MAKHNCASVKEFANWLEGNDIGIEKIYMHTHGQPPLEVSAVFYNMALNIASNKIELQGIDSVFTVSCIRSITVTADKRHKGIAVSIECECNTGAYSFDLKLL